MKNIIKTLLVIITLICNFKLDAAPPRSYPIVYQSWYNKYQEIVHFNLQEIDQFMWIYDCPIVNIPPSYYTGIWYYVGGVLQPNFPIVTNTQFPISFNNYTINYTVDNNSVGVHDTCHSRAKIVSSGATVAWIVIFTLNAQELAADGTFIRNFTQSSWVIIQPNSSWEGDPFAGLNYNNGTMTYMMLSP